MADNKMQNKIIYDRAKAAALSRDYTLATRLFKGLLSSDPENVEFLEGLGDVYEKSGADANAIPLYREVVRLQPSNVNALNRLAGIYRRLKRYDDSISMLEQALITDESNVQVYYNLGFTYKLMGKYDDAVECFNRVIEENPSDVLTYNHLGSIFDAQSNYQKAVSAYQRGLKVDPNHPILHLNLAHTYESLEELELAEKEYEAALRSKPGWLEAIDGYAGLLLKKDEAKNAGAIIQQAISLNPESVKLHSKMGDVYSGQQLYEEAEDEYKEALKYDENYAAALSGLANAYEATGKKAEALRTVQKLEKVQPENSDTQQQYSYHLLSSNKLNAASRKIKQLWDRNPDDVRTLNLLAQYYICKGEDSKAQGCFKKIEEINPQYTTHLRDAGDRYHQKGRYKKAEDYYLRYLESHTGDSSSMLKLAKNYEKLGLYDKALAYYQMLQTRDATNPVYSQNLERVSALCVSRPSQVPSPEPVIEENEMPEIPVEENPVPDVSNSIDEDIAPVVEEEDDEPDFGDTFSELEQDTADAREVIDSDELDAPDIDDSKGVDLDSLVPDSDGLDEADDFFADNPFGASDATLPTHEEDMGDMFQKEELEEEDDFVPPPPPVPPVKKTAPKHEIEDEPNAFEDDFSIDDLDAVPAPEPEPEPEPELVIDDIPQMVSMEEPAAEEEEALAEEEPVAQEEEALAEEEPVTEEKEALAEEELAAQEEEALAEEEPAAEEEPVLDDADIFSVTPESSESGEELDEEAEEALSLLQKLKSLIPYLPEEKQSEFSSSHARLLMDYLIARLSGKEGLLALSSRMRSQLGLEEQQVSQNGAGLVSDVVSGMESYVASIPDANLARTLEGELNAVLHKLEDSKE